MGSKLKVVGRILLEMFVIWIIFEWNDKWVINHIMSVFDQVNISPYINSIGSFLTWMSPYSRNIATGETLTWLNISSGIVLFCALCNLYVSSLGTLKSFFYKAFVVIIINFIVWYVFLGISYFMSNSTVTGTVNRWAIFLIAGLIAEAIALYLQYVVYDIDDNNSAAAN